jgi:hypothetical protein
VAKQYESWRKIVNATRGEREELPKWSAASVLDHWQNHTCDPEICQWMDMMSCRYTMTKIRSTGLEKRHKITGEVKHDKDQWLVWQSATRLFYTLSAKDPRKLSFFKEGSMINRKSMSNGGISRSKRPMFDFFSKSKRIRVASEGETAGE